MEEVIVHIVDLVCNYAAEQRSGVPDPFSDLMESLRENHDEIRRNIEDNVDINQFASSDAGTGSCYATSDVSVKLTRSHTNRNCLLCLV